MTALSIIISDIKDIWVWITNYLFYRRHSLKLSLAMRLADMKQRAYNKRYFVVLVELPKGDKLVSINNDDFKRLKRKRWLPKGMSMLDLEQEAFYQTSLAKNNTSSKEERQKAKKKYIKYAEKYMK